MIYPTRILGVPKGFFLKSVNLIKEGSFKQNEKAGKKTFNITGEE